MLDESRYSDNHLIVKPPFGEKYENVSIRCSLCRRQMIHMHNCLEIIYVFSGCIEVKVSFEKIVVEPGEFIAVNQYDVHSITAIDSEALVANIHISDEMHPSDDGFIVWWTEALKHDRGIYDKQACDIRNLIVQYYNNAPERIVMLSVDNIVRTFQNELKVEAFHRSGNPGEYSESELKRIHSIYMYLYEHFDEKLSLDKMAHDFALSPSYMSHYIKAVTGSNFQTALVTIRCERAETDILGSRLTIAEISEKYGFSSSRYFSSAFRKCFGISPTEHRKVNLINTITHRDNQEIIVEKVNDYIDEKQYDGQENNISIRLNMDDANITVISNVGRNETIDHLQIRNSEGAKIDINGDETMIIIRKA